MAPVRSKINAIWQGEGSQSAKSRMLQHLMMERYIATQSNTNTTNALGSPPGPEFAMPLTPPPSSPGMVSAGLAQSPPGPETFQLLASDIERTYAPPKPRETSKGDGTDVTDTVDSPAEEEIPQMGCKHYVRNVKPQCNICQRFYPCRLCHDEAVKDHALPRHSTRNMLCMHCLTPQPVAQWCKQCGECAGTYYCTVCKLWNSDSEKSIYHCDDCGICRLGQGLGKDFYHCSVCAVCISINVAQTHRCIEQSTKCDCPICGEYMFTSPDTVVFMRCGHSIHENCFREWCKTAYKCPICSKSVVNMESQFRRLDRHIDTQPMPEEYRDTKAIIHCNDCFHKSVVPFHWLGLRCEHCEGYNTTQLEVINPPNLDDQTEQPPPDPENLTPQAENANEAIVSAMAQRAATLAGSQHPSTARSEVATSATSPWLIPRHRSTRSASPAISNYFGLERRDSPRQPNVQTSTENTTEDQSDDELEFWGGHSPRSLGSFLERMRSPRVNWDDSESESDESMDDEDDEDEEMEEDDDDDEEDEIALFGHR